jgi:protein-disulfide isomerase
MHRLLLTLGMAVALVLSMTRLAQAQTAACDGLQGDKRQLAQDIMQAQKPYACCDGTIAECAAKRPRCVVARRLADDVCRRASAGQDRAAIERALTKRAESMNRSGASVPIDLARSTPVGDADGKVIVVAYVCGRCPFCSKLIPAIKRQIADGALKGKAKLYLKLFPIRTHAYSTESGKGALAAQELGKFWPFMEQLYSHFDDFDVAKLADYAVGAGMDRAAFNTLFNDAAITTRLVDSKKEGIRNKVEATPTIFLNGFKVSGDLNTVTVQDLVEEEFDRMTGKTTE